MIVTNPLYTPVDVHSTKCLFIKEKIRYCIRLWSTNI